VGVLCVFWSFFSLANCPPHLFSVVVVEFLDVLFQKADGKLIYPTRPFFYEIALSRPGGYAFGSFHPAFLHLMECRLPTFGKHNSRLDVRCFRFFVPRQERYLFLLEYVAGRPRGFNRMPRQDVSLPIRRRQTQAVELAPSSPVSLPFCNS